jgi:methylthioribose-1-phosphate isomerase
MGKKKKKKKREKKKKKKKQNMYSIHASRHTALNKKKVEKKVTLKKDKAQIEVISVGFGLRNWLKSS